MFLTQEPTLLSEKHFKGQTARSEMFSFFCKKNKSKLEVLDKTLELRGQRYFHLKRWVKEDLPSFTEDTRLTL